MENGRIDWLKDELGEIKSDLKEMRKEFDQRLEGLDERLSRLEQWQSNFLGRAAVIGGLLVIILPVVLNVIKELMLRGR